MRLYIVRMLTTICFVLIVIVNRISDVFASANADRPYMKYLVIAFILALLASIFMFSTAGL